MPRLVALVAVAAAVAAACSTAGGQRVGGEVEVRPFSEIQEGDLSFEADPLDPSRGIFQVTTTEPAICAIVWGETDEFGRFNNSLSMDGTGIIEHDVVLPDVEPDQQYRFVLQGTTADGTLYRSEEVGTFTIPATEASSAPTVERGPNLAEGASVVDVSSEFSEDFAAAFAVDGDLSTEWSSRGDGDDGSLTIDLGEPTEIGGVGFLTRSMADGSAITETFTVTVDDGDALGPFPAGSPAEPAVADVQATGQMLRFDVDASSGGNVGAVEVQVFGP